MQIVAVIPARMASTRYPGKPILLLAGKPMIQWVYEAACASEIPAAVVVATPDGEIASVARGFGAEVVMTRDDHPSGTDRIAEAALTIGADAYVNVQGDEPMIPPATIDACARALLDGAEMSSIFDWCDDRDFGNPNVVKVVTDKDGYALYFSRNAIPFCRGDFSTRAKRHVGLYGYRADVLAKFSAMPQGDLEKSEMLEQLRFLENGVRIKMSYGKGSSVAIDTPEQAKEAELMLAQGENQCSS